MAVIAFLLAAAAVETRADQARMVIRVYDVATRDAALRAAAMGTAAAIVADAGLVVDWHDCSRDAVDYPCLALRGPRDLVVRIMPAGGSQTSRGAVSTRRTLSDSDLQLGTAAVDPETRTGVMATLYYNRVRAVAYRAGVDRAALLGRAMAHEIGHLVLRTAAHGSTGLMRAVWTDEELSRNQAEDWVFAPSERRQLDPVTSQATALEPAPVRVGLLSAPPR